MNRFCDKLGWFLLNAALQIYVSDRDHANRQALPQNNQQPRGHEEQATPDRSQLGEKFVVHSGLGSNKTGETNRRVALCSAALAIPLPEEVHRECYSSRNAEAAFDSSIVARDHCNVALDIAISAAVTDRLKR